MVEKTSQQRINTPKPWDEIVTTPIQREHGEKTEKKMKQRSKIKN